MIEPIKNPPPPPQGQSVLTQHAIVLHKALTALAGYNLLMRAENVAVWMISTCILHNVNQ